MRIFRRVDRRCFLWQLQASANDQTPRVPIIFLNFFSGSAMIAYVVLKLNADIKSTLFDTTVDNIKEDRTQNEHYTYKVFSQP